MEDIKFDSKNVRKHGDKNKDTIKSSLVDLGAGRSILLDADNVIIGGNGVYEQAQSLGLKVRVVESDGTELIAVKRTDLKTDDEKRKLLALADNRTAELAEWDSDAVREIMVELGDTSAVNDMLGKIGLDQDFLDGLGIGGGGGRDGVGNAQAKTDDAAKLNRKWEVKSGDMFRIGNHRLLCGSCVERGDMMRLMGNEVADCVFTSPPYAVGVDYGETYVDSLDNLRKMLPLLADIWMEVVCGGGFAVVNFGDIISASEIVGTAGPCEYPMALEYWPVFRKAGWVLWSRRIWCKPGAGTGSMQCISSNRAATNWEHIWTWKKDGPVMFDRQTTGEYASQNGWIDSTHGEAMDYGLKVHGAGMPLLPAMYSVSNHSREGRIVFEPFTGTGTTMVASENLKRVCYGTEINPDYCAVILERMSDSFSGIEIKRLK